MANNVLIASLIFILFFWASSPANAQSVVVGGMNVTGVLCCAANLTCPGAPLSGAVMELNCTDIAGTVAQAVTAADGAFNMSVPPEAGLLLRSPLSSSHIPCTLSAPLGATTNCSLLSHEILVAPLQALGGPVSTPTGSVQIAVNGAFTLLDPAGF